MQGRRRWINGIVGVWALLVLFVGNVYARDVRQGENCVIDADTVIEGTLFVLCENLDLRGTVQGNVIGAALRGSISGKIEGSVYLIGGQIQLAGEVTRDVHFAGFALHVRPLPDALPVTIGGGLVNFTLQTILDQTSAIHGDLLGVGYQLDMQGTLDGELHFWGAGLSIAGSIGGSVYASVGDPTSEASQIETLLLPLSFEIELANPGLIVTNTASIVGTLDYTGPTAGIFPSRWHTRTTYTATTPSLPNLEKPASFTIYVDQFIREATTLLSIGVMGWLFTPNLPRWALANLRFRPIGSFSVGMLAFILSFPVVLIMLFLTLAVLLILLLLNLSGVALAVGVVLGMANLGGITVFYFVAIFLARVLVGYALGRVVITLVWGQTTDRRAYLASMVVGVILLALVSSLPLIGWVFNAAALFLGLGAILNTFLERMRTLRETLPVTPPPNYDSMAVAAVPDAAEILLPPPEVAPATPPTVEVPRLPAPQGTGTEDLPEGFDWKFFDE